jgi:hypothetical protein
MSVGLTKSAISNNMAEEEMSVFISTNRGDAIQSFDQIRRLKA